MADEAPGLVGSPDDLESHSEDESITLSDVISCIQTDLNSQSGAGLNAAALPLHPQASSRLIQPAKSSAPKEMDKPHVEIIEQPASKALRFRYQCEGRSAGSIPGVNSTTDVKTYPSIQIVGYKGPAIVLVSCVTKDPPYRPHPHNLVGREGCNRGVCVLEIPQDTMSISFSNLGIQCVKKKDIAEHLDVRQAHKVDPFRTGFQHKNQPTSIDLNVVRLCFQVFIQNLAKGDKKCTMPLPPVVSDPIYDKKAMCDLTIVKLSDCVSAVDGGRKDIILLCEKVTKEDIEVRFYEEQNGQVTWEARGDFQPSQVHKQTAIWFRAPRYHRLDITEPVRVCIQLRRPSDGATSEPLPFEMLPLDSGLKRKRKLDSEPNINVLRPLQEHMQGNRQQCNIINNWPLDIKEEPLDAQPNVSPSYLGHSPSYGNPSVSPNYYPPGPIAGANIPVPQTDPNYQYCQQHIPHMNDFQQHQEPQWNVPMAGPSQMPPHEQHQHQQQPQSDMPMSIELNLDAPLLNSKELAQYKFDPNALSENLSNSLLISDLPSTAMTSDSLSKLAEATYDKFFTQSTQQ